MIELITFSVAAFIAGIVWIFAYAVAAFIAGIVWIFAYALACFVVLPPWLNVFPDHLIYTEQEWRVIWAVDRMTRDWERLILGIAAVGHAADQTRQTFAGLLPLITTGYDLDEGDKPNG